MNTERAGRRGGRGRERASTGTPRTNYINLRHPFAPQAAFSEDRIAAMHDTALRVLEELGIRVLLDEGLQLFRDAGAIVDEETQMVRLGRDIVEGALKTAPRSFRMRAASPARENMFEPGAMLFMPGSGCPNVTDRERGRRPGTLRDFRETIRLAQSFDVIHSLGASAEPQDVAIHLRHYEQTRTQLELADKPMFIYARGRGQVMQSFDLIRHGLNLSDDDFIDGVWATTVINSNSPRQLDKPMTQAIIDFAREGQLSVLTPFCLAGAMAPVTVAGALTLQHAEALFMIALSQIAKPGAPVAYGGFASNVDMKSGSPAFGTPEHIQACLGSGQLARFINMPWRSAAGSTSNIADAQGAQETTLSLFGAVLANATMTIHSAGWLEGGLTFGYEKFISDVEALQTIAELTRQAPQDDDDLAFRAIADVQPGGHFFATAHTMERYREAFYQPLLTDLSNNGAWIAAGAKDANERATDIWKQVLADFKPPAHGGDAMERIAPMIEKMASAGGSPPLD